MKTTTIFMDLETGGVEDHHPDIQLAAVAVREWEILDTFERKIAFDERAADPEALRINSYDRDVWYDKALPEEQVVLEFAGFLEQYRVLRKVSRRGNVFHVARLAGHNVARFDAPRLLRMFKRNRGTFLPGDAFMPLDTMQLALWYFADTDEKPENFKLGTLCDFFAIDTEGAHDALADVLNTVELAQHLADGFLPDLKTAA